MLKIYGSPLCPDCTACKAAFDANGIAYDFIDITGSMRNLKEFLKQRDSKAEFDDARLKGYVGIPALMLENGDITLDWETYLKEKGLSSDNAVPSGKACRIDGSGC
jgi:glutaredoxin-related protein